jgi:membrane protease YdiL (CAAX protease family)
MVSLDSDLWRAAWVPTVVLLAYGNISTAVACSWQPADRPRLLYVVHALLVVLAVAWALGPAQLTMSDLGLGPAGGAWSVLLAISVGVVVAMTLRRQGPSRGAPAAHLPSTGVRTELGYALYVLVATAACEEFWFRGLLQACWIRVLGPEGGILVVALWFAAWHLVVLGRILRAAAPIWPVPIVLTYPVGLLMLWAAGLGFGWLRQASSALATPILAHWMIVLGTSYVFAWLRQQYAAPAER